MTARVPTHCAKCRTPVGPWEPLQGDLCVCCDPRLRTSQDTATQIARVLHESETPLHIWDIQRLSAKRRWERPALNTVAQTLSQRQFSWAGRSLYGLYRHGLLPGARSLDVVAGVVVHVADRYLTVAETHYVIRSIGYRHAVGSVNQALNRAWQNGLCTAYTDGTYRGTPTSEVEQRSVARALGFARRGPAFYSVIERAQSQVRSALAERRHRVA